MRRLFIASLLIGTVLSGAAAAQELGKVPLGPNADLGGMRLLPADSPWHKDISKEPVDPRSGRILAKAGLDKPLHPDLGDEWEGAPIGIPYVVVGEGSAESAAPLRLRRRERSRPVSDPAERADRGRPQRDGDRHVLALDRDSWTLYELFNAFHSAGPAGKPTAARSGT